MNLKIIILVQLLTFNSGKLVHTVYYLNHNAVIMSQ